jgi:AraC family transcriptional regulator, regulatory protein of adaptative response / methylphosphotriester-DNA alkyltransferase methyltransferase
MTAGELPFNGSSRAATTEARRALYDDALAIIRREFAGDLRLAEVARRIGASSRALQRAFAEHGDLSFSEELRATRLNVAARLLRGTDLPVGAVARRVGYCDHAPFTKAFRRQHGMSPRAYAARGRPFGGNGQGPAVSALRIQDRSLAVGGAAGWGGGGAAPPAPLD